MTQEFDFHASIKWLAEAEQECPRQVPGTVGSGYHDGPGDGCEFTGRIVPFASLRVECNPDSFDHQRGTCDCEDSGWVPEPDVEKACWRAFWLLPYKVRNAINGSGIGLGREEVVLRVAEAWVKEQP